MKSILNLLKNFVELTISPELLGQLQASDGAVPRLLTPPASVEPPEAPLSEADFRYQLNEDAMATEKLAEGIRLFAADALKLDALIDAQLASPASA